ncbi:DUF4177 domain-containing protein [Luteolibacter sp. SL250]|uniref:DUF4177 domain-containing protein n=1 Tax=Luteolibacter sp. SL250 TaxID=2995170 RepID=UPI002270DA3C|nr:DUF4177 domain-containing protein [Luteolibacter sp. SL250]WAC19161.1 DUF4177 domain-containing protein [Luteolibacter sp. SL250]
MIRWEYRTVKFGGGGISTPSDLQDYLNRLGDQCWEVTGVLKTDADHHLKEFIILMKRPKE